MRECGKGREEARRRKRRASKKRRPTAAARLFRRRRPCRGQGRKTTRCFARTPRGTRRRRVFWEGARRRRRCFGGGVEKGAPPGGAARVQRRPFSYLGRARAKWADKKTRRAAAATSAKAANAAPSRRRGRAPVFPCRWAFVAQADSRSHSRSLFISIIKSEITGPPRNRTSFCVCCHVSRKSLFPLSAKGANKPI